MERSRRSVLLSVPPLWLIGVCLFLPTVRACERMETPASLIRGGPVLFSGMLAPYLFAELLAILCIVALARHRLTPFLRRATLAAVALSGASACVLTYMSFFPESNHTEQQWGVFDLACIAAAVAAVWRARRAGEWTRQARALVAFTFLTLQMAVFLARIGITDGPRHLGYGAWPLFAAVVALCAIHVRDLVPSSSA